MKQLEIFTDGSCLGNPGPGGWAAILRYKGSIKEITGGESLTTNNRMEMLAVINALKQLKQPCKVDLYTDSKYVITGITEYIFKWQSNNWNNGKVKNIDLWQELITLAKIHQISWHWVKGHSGHPENEQANDLAQDTALKYKKMESNV
ncbi:ribonuclease HI [Rickettsiales endosymbiont of Stachyamoeba lipophora]|uniref:ribonuclease HI n=1 Tax=Rickettsiales endosymbiont of Stachyamoeba lipophora TaxID=2486578 RepID=UPI000F652746|nr:ribonuclease HI [Rickettsiales endosymbiont of Stachyamoeba lipophora]AZL15430.1 ribonuclease HI [Rickettsiales endosymbiont of Stachyamoeba lipophora]